MGELDALYLAPAVSGRGVGRLLQQNCLHRLVSMGCRDAIVGDPGIDASCRYRRRSGCHRRFQEHGPRGYPRQLCR
ncbi:MAG: hypothetical protein ABR615_07315 [Pseudonocardiaceae bacterium]